MNLPISLYVALRYWRAKSADRFGRLVANLASFGIVLGVMALIIVLSVMNGLEGYQKQQVLSSIPHAIVSQEAPISAEKTLEIHRTLCKKPCRLIRRMSYFKRQKA